MGSSKEKDKSKNDISYKPNNIIESKKTKPLPQKPITIPGSNNINDDSTHKHLISPPPFENVLGSDSFSGSGSLIDSVGSLPSEFHHPSLLEDGRGNPITHSNSYTPPPFNHSGTFSSSFSSNPFAKLTLGRSSTSKDSSKFNIDDIINRLLAVRPPPNSSTNMNSKYSKNVCIKNSEIITLLQKVREIFLDQPVLLHLTPNPSLAIAGDVHGRT